MLPFCKDSSRHSSCNCKDVYNMFLSIWALSVVSFWDIVKSKVKNLLETL